MVSGVASHVPYDVSYAPVLSLALLVPVRTHVVPDTAHPD